MEGLELHCLSTSSVLREQFTHSVHVLTGQNERQEKQQGKDFLRSRAGISDNSSDMQINSQIKRWGKIPTDHKGKRYECQAEGA